MKNFLEKFGVELDESKAGLFEKAVELEKQRGNEIFEFEKLDIYTYMKEDLAKIRDFLAKNKDNAIYSYLLYLALEENDKEVIGALSHPKADMTDEQNDTLPIFGLLYCVPKMIGELKKKGLTDEIIHDTCNMFENQMQDFIDLNGHYGISDYVAWMKRFLDCKIIRIGRFNFEYGKAFSNRYVFYNGERLEVFSENITYHSSGKMLGSVGCLDENGSFTPDVKETDDEFIGCPLHNGFCEKTPVALKKSEWKKIISPGDPVIHLHIPSGGRLDPVEGEKDILRAYSIFKKSYGQVNGLMAESWIMSEELVELIGKPSGLTWFARLFRTFPFKCRGNDVFEYLYLLPPSTPLETLPEKSSLQKKVKDYLIKGNHIYETMGVFIVEKERLVK